MEWIKSKIDEYYEWLRNNTEIRKDFGTGWFAVSTPFVGLFNDNIEIYVKKVNDTEILLSDDGETLNALSLSGVDILRSPKRREILQRILASYGIDINGTELVTTSNGADFARKKHNFVSAISHVSDLDVLAESSVKSVFVEDVRDFLDTTNIVYTPSFTIRGRSGLDFNFDFQIAGRKSEVAVKTFPSLKQSNLSTYLFCLHDTKDAREQETRKELRNVAIIDNLKKEPQDRFMSALKEYGVDVLLWKDIRERQDLLRAV